MDQVLFFILEGQLLACLLFFGQNNNDSLHMKALSLLELNALVGEVIDQALDQSYWVEAELSEVRERGGHCYMSLVEKEEGRNTPVAQAQARCWRNRWMLMRPYFERTTGHPIHAGMKVMLQVHAQFHPLYGFSWIVDDINPEYSLGDMMRHRQEILWQLKEEGVIDLNKQLPFPRFAQRVAVVSSEGAAGYGDFKNQLENNEYGLQFTLRLFPATMQGESVESSVIEALNAIYDAVADYDVVVIIRGGGAVADLSGFDSLLLAENVANFPLPVITGIGHERDESVIDFVSHTRVKTPTAAAAFLIDHLATVLEAVETAQERATRYARQRMEAEQQRLHVLSTSITSLFSVVKVRQEARLSSLSDRIGHAVEQNLEEARHQLGLLTVNLRLPLERRLLNACHQLDLLEQKARALDPRLLLKRGYSLTLHEGKVVKSARSLSPGDIIDTQFAQGHVRSKVEA